MKPGNPPGTVTDWLHPRHHFPNGLPMAKNKASTETETIAEHLMDSIRHLRKAAVIAEGEVLGQIQRLERAATDLMSKVSKQIDSALQKRIMADRGETQAVAKKKKVTKTK